MVVAVALRLWAPAGVAGAVAGLIAILVLPRALPRDQSALPSDGPGLRVITANLLLGRADPGAVVDLVRDQQIDLLSLQELTRKENRALQEAGLARLLPERRVFTAPAFSGAALYSRWPLEGGELIGGSGGLLPMPRSRVRVPEAAPVEVVDAHPPPPTSSEQASVWELGLQSLPSTDPQGMVRLLLGDFNATLDHQARCPRPRVRRRSRCGGEGAHADLAARTFAAPDGDHRPRAGRRTGAGARRGHSRAARLGPSSGDNGARVAVRWWSGQASGNGSAPGRCRSQVRGRPSTARGRARGPWPRRRGCPREP